MYAQAGTGWLLLDLGLVLGDEPSELSCIIPNHTTYFPPHLQIVCVVQTPTITWGMELVIYVPVYASEVALEISQ